MVTVLDPVLERLSGRHLLGCVVWHTEQAVDAHLCACPADPQTETREAMYGDMAATLPLAAASVARRIAEVARWDPDGARATADGVVRQVLARIASGHEPPELVQRLADAALVVAGGWRS